MRELLECLGMRLGGLGMRLSPRLFLITDLELFLHCRMRELLDFLPLSNKDPVPIRYTEDPK